MAKTTPRQKQRLRKALGGAAKHRKLKKKLGVQPKKPKYAAKAQAAAKTRKVTRKVKKMLGVKNPNQKKALKRKANLKGKKITGGVNVKKYVKSSPLKKKK